MSWWLVAAFLAMWAGFLAAFEGAAVLLEADVRGAFRVAEGVIIAFTAGAVALADMLTREDSKIQEESS